jgi:hypothetical protein
MTAILVFGRGRAEKFAWQLWQRRERDAAMTSRSLALRSRHSLKPAEQSMSAIRAKQTLTQKGSTSVFGQERPVELSFNRSASD